MTTNQENFICDICNKTHPHTHYMTPDTWIGVDFDDTLALHVPNRSDPYTLGGPVPAMVNRVKAWLAKGYKVKILTARMYPISHTGVPRDLDKMDRMLRDWTLQHIGQELENTCQKDGWMVAIWDDRGVQVANNLGIPTDVAINAELDSMNFNYQALLKEHKELKDKYRKLQDTHSIEISISNERGQYIEQLLAELSGKHQETLTAAKLGFIAGYYKRPEISADIQKAIRENLTHPLVAESECIDEHFNRFAISELVDLLPEME